MRAGHAEHEVERRDGRVIIAFFHGRDQLRVKEAQQTVKVDLLRLTVTLHQGHSDLGSEVAGAAGHAQQPAVEHGGAGSPCGHGVGRRQAEVVVTMESHGDFHGLDQRLDVFGNFLGQHGSRRIHDGDGVETGVLEHFRLFGQFFRGADIRLHQRVIGLQPFLLDVLDRLERKRGAFAGVGADAQERQSFFGRQVNGRLRIAFGVEEHAQRAAGKVGPGEIKILFVVQRGDGVGILVGADAFGVAEFDLGDAVVQQPLDHHSR